MKCHYQIDRSAGTAKSMTVFLTPENPAEASLFEDALALKAGRADYGETANDFSLFVKIFLK